MRHFLSPVILAWLAATLMWNPLTTHAATLPDGFQDEAVLGGFELPMSLRFLPDGRMLVTERSPARIKVVAADGSTVLTTALTIANVPGEGERGLLSIAVDPEWPQRAYVYAFYARENGSNNLILTRYTATGDLDGTGNGSLSLGQGLDLMKDIPDLCQNHNGGDLRFAPDGMLFLSVGDDENKCAVQDLGSVLGKILRLRVDHLPATGTITLADLVPDDNPYAGSPDLEQRLVWTHGLRNPFRMHVDPLDGSIFVADVGWNLREEVSHVEGPSVNLGWPYIEGFQPIDTAYNNNCVCWTSCSCSIPSGFTSQDPIAEIRHNGAGRSVVSVGIYRAPAGATAPWPVEYHGDYFYADFFDGKIRRIQGSGQNWSLAPAVPGQPDPDHWATDLGSGLVDFALGPDGSLYYLNLYSGELRRIVSTTTTAAPVGSGLELDMWAQPSTMTARTSLRFSRGLELPNQVRIYDVAGRLVRALDVGVDADRVIWDGRDDTEREVASGVYFARLEINGKSTQAKVVKVR